MYNFNNLKKDFKMKIEDIKDTIKKVIENKIDYKSILIDGSWGCGKTTVVKDAISELTDDAISRKKLVYQSLFGIKDVSELVACFSFTGKIIYSLGRSIASPFTKLIPIVGDQIKESIDNSTALFTPSPSKKKDTLFIFDDLERADELLSYIALLGFFNQLIMRGCKIICVSSLNDLSKMDVKRKKGLDAFLEKAFDRIMYINEYPAEIITKIFEDDEKTKHNIKQCIDMFDCNIRIALKTHRLLKDVYKKQSVYKYNINRKNNDLQVLKATICAIKSIYYFKEKEDNDENDQKQNPFEKILFDRESGQLDSRILKNIKEVINKNSAYFLPEELEEAKNLTKSICMVDVHNDYTMLVKNYSSEIKKEQKDIYDVSVFYFDDKGKKDYFLKFKKDTLAGKLAINRAYIDRLIEIIKYTDSDLKKDGLLDNIITKVISNYSSGDKSAYQRLEDYINFPEEANDKKIVKDIFSEISSQLHKVETDSLELEMNNAFKNGDYRYLLDLLYEVEHYKKPEHIRTNVKKILLSNHFYLPDLSKTIDYESWSYCHQVARLSKLDQELSIAFIDVMKEDVVNNKESVSAVDRAKALVQYNFEADIFNEFLSFCEQVLNKK